MFIYEYWPPCICGHVREDHAPGYRFCAHCKCGQYLDNWKTMLAGLTTSGSKKI